MRSQFKKVPTDSRFPRASALVIAAEFFLAVAITLAAQAPTHPDVSGTWVDQSNNSSKWILTEKDGSIHVVEMKGDRVETEFTCPMNGQECAIAGRHEKAMVYYNGDKLVEITEGHEGSVKKRLTVSADGKTLAVELVPLTSTEKTENLVFRRDQTM
jgi:hypothetical protein